MVVAAGGDAGAGLGLVLAEDGEDAEDDGDARVELDAHEAVGDAVGDVLKVHGLALDEDANRDDGVKGGGRGRGGAGRGGGGGVGEGGQVRGRGAEEVARGAAGRGGGGLDLGGGEEAVGERGPGRPPVVSFVGWSRGRS